jgi:hypothetical protein
VFAFEKKEKTSQYKGVCWSKRMGKWHAQLSLKEGKSKYGGNFQDELDASVQCQINNIK